LIVSRDHHNVTRLSMLQFYSRSIYFYIRNLIFDKLIKKKEDKIKTLDSVIFSRMRNWQEVFLAASEMP